MTLVFNRHSDRVKRRQLRHSMPEPEVILWFRLKGREFGGYKFRRQYGIGRYVVDFYCPHVKLVVEIDGDSHYTDEAIEYDQEREAVIQSFGIKVIRFTNHEIRKNLDGVLEVIRSNFSPPYQGRGGRRRRKPPLRPVQ